jgi:hypothetical protein
MQLYLGFPLISRQSRFKQCYLLKLVLHPLVEFIYFRVLETHGLLDGLLLLLEALSLALDDVLGLLVEGEFEFFELTTLLAELLSLLVLVKLYLLPLGLDLVPVSLDLLHHPLSLPLELLHARPHGVYLLRQRLVCAVVLFGLLGLLKVLALDDF